MTMAWESLEDLLKGRVEAKKSKAGIRSRMKRVVRKAPEVMVKISGNAKGGAHLQSHLLYISRNGKLDLETEQGEAIIDKQGLKELIAEWKNDVGERNERTRDTYNIVLSMPSGTDPQGVKQAARNFAKSRFSENHQYVFVLHTDSDHPHVHLTVKSLGFDGTRLHVKRGDPQIWREEFAEELRSIGIEAEATPRKIRGVVKKPVSQPVFHLRQRGKAKTDAEKIKEIIGEFRQGKFSEKPWESRIKETQHNIRKLWLREAQKAKLDNDLGTVKEVLDFVNSMPPIATERQTLALKLSRMLEAENKQQVSRNEPEDDLER